MLEIVIVVVVGKFFFCLNYDGNVMEFYCQFCEIVMCWECMEGEYVEYFIVLFKDVVEQYKVLFQVQLDVVNKRFLEIDFVFQFILEIIYQLINQKVSIVDDIYFIFDEFQKILNVCKSVLFMELEVNYGFKYKVFQLQLDILFQGQESIKSCSNFIVQVFNYGMEIEVLLVKKQMSEKLNELVDQDFFLYLWENDQLDFIVEIEGLKKFIYNFGMILIINVVVLEMVVMGEGLWQIIIGQFMFVIIIIKDKDGELCKIGNVYFIVELSILDGSVVDGEILDNKNGIYEFLYIVQKEGDFILFLRFYDQYI